MFFDFKWIYVKKHWQSYLNWWKSVRCGMGNYKFSTGIYGENLFHFFNVVSEFSVCNGSKFSPIHLYYFFHRNFLFLFTLIPPKYTHIICPKEIDSVQFIYLHWSVVRKMVNWMLKTSEQKIGFFYATPEWIQDLNCETVRAYIR